MPVLSGVNSTVTGSDSTICASTPYNPGAGNLPILFFGTTDYNGILPTVISNAVAVNRGWDFIGKASYRTSLDTLWCFVATGPSVDSGGTTVTATLPFDCSGYFSIQRKAEGMARFGRAAIRQFAVTPEQAAGAIPAITFDKACLADNPTLTVVMNGTNPAGVTVPVGWTSGVNTGYSTPTTGCRVATRDSGFSGTTITWGGTSATDFAVIGLELDASALTANDAPPLVAGWGGTR